VAVLETQAGITGGLEAEKGVGPVMDAENFLLGDGCHVFTAAV